MSPESKILKGSSRSVDDPLMAPIAAAMYLIAALVVAVSMLLPQPAEVNRLGMLAVAGMAFAAAALIWAFRAVLPRRCFHLTAAAGTLMTGLAVYWSGESDSPYALLVLWVAVFTGCFFTARQVAAHLALAGAVYALALALHPHGDGDTAAHWLVTMATAAVAAIAILHLVSARHRLERQREQLLAQTMELALTDPLTGLPNRRAWHERLEIELADARRHSRPICVAMLDLDHFKAFNDRHGHVAGDELLREVAAAWKDRLRPGDTIARYGGEEFALLLPDCELDDAVTVVDRLRGGLPRDERCSAGIAAWDFAETPLELLARSDERLYAAKQLGRDRLVAAA